MILSFCGYAIKINVRKKRGIKKVFDLDHHRNNRNQLILL